MASQASSFIIDHQNPKFGYIGTVTDRDELVCINGELVIMTWTSDYQINGAVHPRLFSFLTNLFLNTRSPLMKSIIEALIYSIFIRIHQTPEVWQVQRVHGKHSIDVRKNQGQFYLKANVVENDMPKQTVITISQADAEGIQRWFIKRNIETC